MGSQEEIIKILKKRERLGLHVYGVSVDRKDFSVDEWILHAQEEMLDGAIYLQRLREEIKEISRTLPSLFFDDNPARISWAEKNVRMCFTSKTTEEAIWTLSSYNGEWDSIYLDHDVVEECADEDAHPRPDGMEVASFIVDNKKKVKAKRIVCHSMNDVGRNEMAKKLSSAGYKVEAVPFIRMSGYGFIS